ncbi:hypothetical protein ACXZ65_17360 [Streptomyces aculeolatus]
MTTPLPARVWTVTISTAAGRSTFACSVCPSPAVASDAPLARQIRRHFAHHLTSAPLPAHLRICQCREHGCAWHRPQVPCSGPLRLLLSRTGAGRTWRLADTCLGCASATPHAAAVPEPLQPTTPSLPPASELLEPMPEPEAWIDAL